MLIATILIFTIAAILGIYLIAYILRNKNTPKGLAIIHGSVAALGIFFLIILMITNHINAYVSLILFILAALGGFTMMFRDITAKTLPKWLALGHGVLAAVGFMVLLYILFT